jgi:hypothetical protein
LKVVETHVGKTPVPKKEFFLGRGKVLVGLVSDRESAEFASMTLTLALFGRFNWLWLALLIR